MKIIQICPKCGMPAVAVNVKAVSFNVNESSKALVDVKNKWSICVNRDCDCSYFSKHLAFMMSDLVAPLFFKDDSGNVPICYCSNLTRGEINNAVENGCKSIDDVQNYTAKDITGLCKERNPLGKCCRNVFLKTISDSLK
jgi:hypothetical protein